MTTSSPTGGYATASPHHYGAALYNTGERHREVLPEIRRYRNQTSAGRSFGQSGAGLAAGDGNHAHGRARTGVNRQAHRYWLCK